MIVNQGGMQVTWFVPFEYPAERTLTYEVASVNLRWVLLLAQV